MRRIIFVPMLRGILLMFGIVLAHLGMGQTVEFQKVSSFTFEDDGRYFSISASDYSVDNFGSSNLLVVSGIEQPDSLTTVGLPEWSQLNVQVYPNPATERLTIQSAESNLHIRVRGMDGSLLLEEVIGITTQLNVSDYASGVYVLEIQHPDNPEKFFLKWVKQ